MAEELGVEVCALLELLLGSELAIHVPHGLFRIIQHRGCTFEIARVRIQIGITPERPEEMWKHMLVQPCPTVEGDTFPECTIGNHPSSARGEDQRALCVAEEHRAKHLQVLGEIVHEIGRPFHPKLIGLLIVHLIFELVGLIVELPGTAIILVESAAKVHFPNLFLAARTSG